MLSHYINSFRTGSMGAYRESQKSWVTDVAPSVENILGFVESYVDPYGVRAQWEGAVCIADHDETKRMDAFIAKSSDFARLLPWATSENNGKGPFEKEVLSVPQFTILHGENLQPSLRLNNCIETDSWSLSTRMLLW